MKALGLQELLRYALAGGIGLAVLLLTYPAVSRSIGGMEAAKETTLVLGLVLLVGTMIYNLHRALLYPVLIRLVGLTSLPWKSSWRLMNPWQPSDAELEVDRWRWNLSNEVRTRWDEWGAQTHSLYCAAWAIFAALLLGNYMGEPSNCRASHVFWSLFAVCLMAGLVNNYRLLYSIIADKNEAGSPS
jgi:hypothetical protein